MNDKNDKTDTTNTADKTEQEKIPRLNIMFSVFPCSITAGEAFEQFGGKEDHKDDGTRFWVFNSPETAQELLQSCITEYKGEEYALKWFDFLDSRIEDMDDGDGLDEFFSRYAKGNDDMDAYAMIEKEWVHSHNFEEALKKFRQGDMSKVPEMSDADDDEWCDAFILNLPATMDTLLPKREAEKTRRQVGDLIDDLALIHMGIGIYAGVRKYDMIEAYAE